MKRPSGSGKSNLSLALQLKLDAYRFEGLIVGDFTPQGESEKELRKSIEAMAYTAWLRSHGHLAHLSVEEVRETFAFRNSRPEPPPFEPGPMPIEFTAPAAPEKDLTRADRVLPRGDAWEPPNESHKYVIGADPALDEDVPPPPEVY
jgi:hypothetical protein